MRYLGSPCKYLQPGFFFFFDLPLKLRVVYLRNKQTNSVTNMKFYKHVQYCFYCYVIKSAGEATNKLLLSVFWNPLLIEINLSQIRTLDIKREKVCAVCPYLLFLFWWVLPPLKIFDTFLTPYICNLYQLDIILWKYCSYVWSNFLIIYVT